MPLLSVLKPQITIRKDHKGHKDRRILTEANEGFSDAKANPADKPFVTFCESAVVVAFVIFPYCANRIGNTL